MQVVIVEPEKKPVVQNIDNTLTSMQQIVGGTIQAVYPFEEPVALICNDEGKPLNLPLNVPVLRLVGIKSLGASEQARVISSPRTKFSDHFTSHCQ